MILDFFQDSTDKMNRHTLTVLLTKAQKYWNGKPSYSLQKSAMLPSIMAALKQGSQPTGVPFI